jgi:cytochrome P450
MTEPTVLEAFQQLWSPAAKADPYPSYAVLRKHASVLPIGPRRAIVTGHVEVREILLNANTFPVCDNNWADREWPSWRKHPAVISLYNALMHQNPPDNQPARRLLVRYFHPHNIAGLRPMFREHAVHHVTSLLAQVSRGDPVDAVDTLLWLPTAVICAVFGFPRTDMPKIRRWTGSIGRANEFNPPGHGLADADADSSAFREYLRPLVRTRKGTNGGDFVTFMASAWPDDEDSLLDTLIFVASAGTETATAMLGSGLEILSARPELMSWLRGHPRYGVAFTRELIRYHPPAQMITRWTAAPTEIGGVRLPRRTAVMLSLGAAGRDPQHHPGPDRFDPMRFDSAAAQRQVLLSFGLGSHRCPGAGLAEAVAEALFTTLTQQCDRVALAEVPQFLPRSSMRSFARLPVQVVRSGRDTELGDDSHA